VHSILLRQLRQLNGLSDLRGRPEFEKFLGVVDRAYEELENDRRFAEHTLGTVSEELYRANERARKESERLIESQAAQLAMAMQSAGDGLWAYDAKAGQLELSPPWIQMLGYGADELPSDLSVCKRLIHPDDWDAARSAIGEVETSDGMIERQVRVTTRSGTPLWMLVRGRVVERDAAGRARRLVGTLINISTQKQIEAELRDAKEVAEAASAAKSRFLAIVSHEIRTPMNGVLGFASLLGETQLNPTQSEYLEMIQGSGKILVAIINDILDFSRIESGALELAQEHFSPVDAIAEVCDLMQPQAREKGIALECPMQANGQLRFLGDSLRFRQILLNLIGNAIKFTEVGGVQVATVDNIGADGQPWLTVEVRDTGSGIPAGNLRSIFEPFAQADMSVTRKYGGTGLGLAITSRLVELMGGAIEVESTPGKGSIFRVHLPRIQHPASMGEPRNGPSAPADTAPMSSLPHARILVVEDNRVNRLLAIRMLNSLGCETAAAENGSEALEMVKNADYDAIFMDLDMPVMDGIASTRLIRQLPGREHLPIYALTANALESDRARCREAGMNGFLAKPYEKAAVTRILGEVSVGVK
jgi:PAS domain S-box-containing protein